MGERLLIESGVQIVRRLTALGYTFDRTRGSHHQYICATRCHLATVDIHGRKDVSKSDMRSIIRQTGCTKDEFYNGVQKCKPIA